MSISRRDFVSAVGASAALAATLPRLASGGVPRKPQPGAPVEGDHARPPASAMPRRKLGRTGVEVSLVGLGGFHIGLPASDDEAVRIVRTAVDHGVTFLDNCWDYNDGRSEERMGKALAGGYRERVFLMTKLDGRTREAAAAQLNQSLKRLKVDSIDLVQIHENIRMGDAERCFAKGGAIEAYVEARRAGKLRFVGFTGHKDPAIHLHMLDVAKQHGFRFDTVQMPLNPMDAHYRSFEKQVLPRLVDEEIGVLGMKPLGSGLLLQSGAVTAIECLHYAMSLPVSVVITGCETMGVLEQALHAAATFAPLDGKAREALLARTAAAGAGGRYERFKTTRDFDGTTQNPRWLESAEP